MPSVHLGKRAAARFEVVGSFSRVPLAVTHAAILAHATDLAPGTSAEVFEMGRTLILSPPNPMKDPAVVGWLPLTRDEEEFLEAWLADVRTRASACQYFAYPADEPIRDPVTGTITSWRFSCAGFVRRAYEEGAGVVLLVPEAELPTLDFATLRQLWAAGISEDSARRMLSRVLRGPEPWPVLLPGYLFHALAQPRESLPFKPWAFQLFFPVPSMT